MELSDIQFQNEMLQAELKMAKLEKEKAELHAEMMENQAAKELKMAKLEKEKAELRAEMMEKKAAKELETVKLKLTELQQQHMDQLAAAGKHKAIGEGQGSSKTLEKETATGNNNLLVANENLGQHETVQPKTEQLEMEVEIVEVVPEKKVKLQGNLLTPTAVTMGKENQQDEFGGLFMPEVVGGQIGGGEQAKDQPNVKGRDMTKKGDSQQTVKGLKRHACKECPKSFDRSDVLKQHQRIHTGERPYKCEVCNYRSTQKSNLKIHIRIHSGEKPYECKACGKCFTQSGSLKTHQKKKTCKPAAPV